ncbi:MAG: hypothetical protein HQM16_01765 [Deltaproteobacteria bacterium]|nr:hypothetical protein [Deltaproteobacteria bacterium]
MTECKTHIFLVGDLQDADRVGTTVIQSETINRQVDSANRLTANELGIGAVYQKLGKQFIEAVPSQCRDEYIAGQIIYGDKPDTSTKGELGSAWKVLESGAQIHPRLRTIEDLNGNHELLPNGTFATGNAFGGALSPLKLLYRSTFGGPGTYEEAVIQQQSGSASEVLTKDYVIDEMEESLGHRDPSHPEKSVPIRLTHSNWENYRTDGPDLKSWADATSVEQTFWQQVPPVNGLPRWHSSIHNTAKGDAVSALESRLHLSASQLGIYDTKAGETPVYHLSLDVDFFEDTSTNGAIHGHLSYVTTHLVRAFMDARLLENPQAKFIIASHYGMDDIEKAGHVRQPHLFGETVLSDDRVIAVINAHKHRFDYKNINDVDQGGEMARKVGLVDVHKEPLRASPLMQFTVPSMIDTPLGAAHMMLGVDENGDLKIEVKTLRIDIEPLETETDPAVVKAVDEFSLDSVTFHKTWDHIADSRLKLIAHTQSTILETLALLAKDHTGLAADMGPVNDVLIARDANIGAVYRAESLLKEYFWVIYFCLLDLGLTEEAQSFKDRYTENLSDTGELFEEGIRRLKGEKSTDTNTETGTQTDHKIPKTALLPGNITTTPAGSAEKVAAGEPQEAPLENDVEQFFKQVGKKLLREEDPSPGRNRITGIDHEQRRLNNQRVRSETKRRETTIAINTALDQLIEKIDQDTPHAAHREKNKLKKLPRLIKKLLLKTDALVDIYQHYVTTYVGSIALGHTDTKLAGQNTMFVDETWREVRALARQLPEDSRASQFMLLASAKTATFRDQYHGRVHTTDAPQNMTITVDANTGRVSSVTNPIPPLSEEEFEKRKKEIYDSFPSRKPDELDTLRKKVDEEYSAIQWDPVLNTGIRGDPLGGLHATLSVGAQIHATGPRDPFDFTAAAALTAGHTLNGGRWFLGGSLRAYFDILHRVAIGAYGEVGTDFTHGLYGAIGPDLSLLDGMIHLSCLYRLQTMPDDGRTITGWRPQFSIDPVRVYKLFSEN